MTIIRLKQGQLDKYCALKGIKGGQAGLARAMNVDRSTVYRTLSGEADLGIVFITALLGAFPELGFEDLFELVAPDFPEQRTGSDISDEVST